MFIKNVSSNFCFFNDGEKEVALAPEDFVTVGKTVASKLQLDYAGILVATETAPWSYATLNGSGDPSGVETPSGIGQIYVDTSASPTDYYISNGVTSADWTLLS